MIRVALAAAVLTAATPACAQDLGNVAALAMMQGKCTRLITPDGDRTARCEGKIINTAYRDNHSNFMVTIGDELVLSFYGEDHAANGDRAVMIIQKITATRLGRISTTSQAAEGQCSYTNPYAGPSHIDCSATAAGRQYAFSFVSDGRPPSVTRF